MQRLGSLQVLLVFPAWRTVVTAGSVGGASELLDHEISSHLRHSSHNDHDVPVHVLQDRRRNNRSEAETQVDADHPAPVSHRARAAHRERLAADDDSGSLQSFAAAAGTALGRQELDRDEGTYASSNASKPLPEHGFHGRLVAHKDGETYTKDSSSAASPSSTTKTTEDFGVEYGPHAKRVTTYEEICAKYPGNEWCRMFHPTVRPRPPVVEASSDDEPSWGEKWPDQLKPKPESDGGRVRPRVPWVESGACAATMVGTLGTAAALL